MKKIGRPPKEQTSKPLTKPARPATKQSGQLTLFDRLSHLSYKQACDILGKEGAYLLRRPYFFDPLNVKKDVFLNEDFFRLSIHESDGTTITVTVTLVSGVKHKLSVCCSQCNPLKQPGQFCEHTAATLSFLLEEKSLIGLANAPDLDTPMELLSEKKLHQRALHEREERSRNEKFRVKPVYPAESKDTPWTDYLISSETSGKTHRVALRGLGTTGSFCSCPDFKTNRLGTCKHLMFLQRKVKKQFPETTLATPYILREAIVYVSYREDRTLRLALPENITVCDCEDCQQILKIAKRFVNTSISDIRGLLNVVSKMEGLGKSVTIFPDAEEWIHAKLSQQKLESLVAEIRQNPKKHPLRKTLLKTELLPYQLDGVAFAVGAGRAILADDMGLGKTIQGIGVAELLANEMDISKVLIVCPASVKSQWRSEIIRFAPHRSAQLVFGGADERFDMYGNDAFFTICNYEQVLRDMIPIEQTRWNLIILDEGQRIKNWESQTARAIKALRAPYALVLSGTPMENRLDELYSVVQFVDDHRLLPAYRFFHKHRIVEDSGRVAGYQKLNELREELKPILLRRTKDSVGLELPERSVEVVRIAPTDEQLTMHASHMMTVASIVAKKHLTEMDILALRRALLMARMSADSTALVDKKKQGFSSKLARMKELLEELLEEDDRKIIVFSEWTSMLDLIEPILTKLAAKFVRLDGSIPQRKRQLLVQQFMEDDTCRVFLMTNAGSVGLNLQAANTVINVDLPWNPAVLEQRIGRAHRMGQRRCVQVYLLVTEQTIEEQMLKTLSAKHDLAMAALDINNDSTEIMLQTGMDELKRRLEVLLGSKPAAAPDISQQRDTEQAAEQLSGTDSVTELSAAEQLAEAAATANRVAETVTPSIFGDTITMEHISTVGGKLLESLFQHDTMTMFHAAAKEVAPQVQKAVAQAVRIEKDTDGNVRLSVSMPEKHVIDNFLTAAAGWFKALTNSNSTSKSDTKHQQDSER